MNGVKQRQKNISTMSKVDRGRLSPQIADCLVELLDQCGVWSPRETDEKPSWKKIAVSLHRIAENVERISLKKIQDPKKDPILLLLEEEFRCVKVESVVLSAQNDKLHERLALCEKLEKLCTTDVSFYSLIPLCSCLLSAVREQKMEITETLTVIETCISGLYDCMDSRASELPAQVIELSLAARKLESRCIDSFQTPWREAKAIITDLLQTKTKAATRDEHFATVTNTNGYNISDLRFQSAEFRVADAWQGTSVLDETISFITCDNSSNAPNKCVLVVGIEGSGKTHMLNCIEKAVMALGKSEVELIRPSLPYDLMGRKVGHAENKLIAFVKYALTRQNAIILLDDIESVFGEPAQGGGDGSTNQSGAALEPHLTSRLRALFLCLLEVISEPDNGRALLICTSREDINKTLGRFDRVVVLDNPSTSERLELLRNFAQISSQTGDLLHSGELLHELVECTAGLSRAELVMHCRGALIDGASTRAGTDSFLAALKKELQTRIPDSLKTGAMSDFVDVTVSTFRDLRGHLIWDSSTEMKAPRLPIYGSSIDAAWNELQRLIITPLCETTALRQLIYHSGETAAKIFAGGVLLTGPPGSGKSSLAYACAAVAASRNPGVKLLDVSCTSLVHKEVGGSEQAIHRLFRTAKAAAPCILLMDGIENIAAVRGNDNTTEGTMDRMLSTLLTELDGVDSDNVSDDSPHCLAIIAVTHDPKWIDPALRRPGRLERVIELDLPELEARKRIVERELSKVSTKGFEQGNVFGMNDAVATFVADRTDGLSGAAVAGVCNEAKMRASRDAILTGKESHTDNEYSVSRQHLEDAILCHLAGRLRNRK